MPPRLRKNRQLGSDAFPVQEETGRTVEVSAVSGHPGALQPAFVPPNLPRHPVPPSTLRSPEPAPATPPTIAAQAPSETAPPDAQADDHLTQQIGSGMEHVSAVAEDVTLAREQPGAAQLPGLQVAEAGG